MPLPAQAKVLRVLQTGEFSRVGGEKTLRIDCRVVAATSRDLEQMVKDGVFREDLYFRLTSCRSVGPSQGAARRHPLLGRELRARVLRRERPRLQAGRRARVRALAAYEWPGNVRELRNVVERLVIMTDEVIRREDSAAEPRRSVRLGVRARAAATAVR